MCQCLLSWRWRFDCFSGGAGGVVAELVPVIAVVADEVGDLAEGLVQGSAFERHGVFGVCDNGGVGVFVSRERWCVGGMGLGGGFLVIFVCGGSWGVITEKHEKIMFFAFTFLLGGHKNSHIILSASGPSFSSCCEKGRESKFSSDDDGGRSCSLTCTGLSAFLEVFVCVVEKFEEVRGLISTKAGDGGIVLVRVIFAGKLLIVDLHFGFGCAESKAESCK